MYTIIIVYTLYDNRTRELMNNIFDKTRSWFDLFSEFFFHLMRILYTFRCFRCTRLTQIHYPLLENIIWKLYYCRSRIFMYIYIRTRGTKLDSDFLSKKFFFSFYTVHETINYIIYTYMNIIYRNIIRNYRTESKPNNTLYRRYIK